MSRWILVGAAIVSLASILEATLPSSSQPTEAMSEKVYASEQDSLLPGGIDVAGANEELYLGTIQCRPQAEGWHLRFLVQVVDTAGKAVRSIPVGEADLKMKAVLPGLFPCVRVLPNGDVLALANLDRQVTSAVRVGPNGEVRFSKRLWPEKVADSAQFRTIVPLSDDAATVLGQVDGKPAVVRVNRLGEIVLHRVLQDMGEGFCSSGAQVSDRDLVVCGLSSSEGGMGSTAWVVRLDAQGNSKKVFKVDNNAPPSLSLPQSYAVETLPDGNVAFVLPVIDADGSNWRLITLGSDMNKLADTKLLSFERIAPCCRMRQTKTGLAVLVYTDIRNAALLSVSSDGTIRAQRNPGRERLLGGNTWLAVKNGITYILAQDGFPSSKEKSTIRLISVRDLESASP